VHDAVAYVERLAEAIEEFGGEATMDRSLRQNFLKRGFRRTNNLNPTQHGMTSELEEIVKTTFSAYNLLPSNGKPDQNQGQWTILAAFILTFNSTGEGIKHLCVALG
jgi:hypothetical protein